MTNEPIAIQLAVLSTQMGFIQQELADAKTARKGQYEKMEEQSQVLTTMDGRMKAVEESLRQQAPTIDEFITIKHKVQGAGVAGRWVWSAVGAVLGMIGLIVAAKSGLISLMTGK